MFIKLMRNLFFSSLLLFIPLTSNVMAADKEMQEVEASQMMEKLNVNKASVEDLSSIKGIGPKKAQAIIDYRNANGDFIDLKEIIKVKGIGKSTLDKISLYLSI